MSASVLEPELCLLRDAEPLRIVGRVATVQGLTLLVDDLPLPVGALVSIPGRTERDGVGYGEVTGFTREHTVVMPLTGADGVRAGDRVIGEHVRQVAAVGDRMLGRVVDGLSRPIDGLGPIHERVHRPLCPRPVPALQRRPITEPLRTGVRAIDLMTPVGKGQRLGIFAGPGVGKSTLLGQLARHAIADVIVIALVGERGREVVEFIERVLGPETLGRCVVVAATGDEAPPMRIRAAMLACAAAEHFRDRGLDVVLMMDSITRFAHAQRQVGLSRGEPPATKGYTPTVFSSLPLLLERAGAVAGDRGCQGGSITGFYTILVEGDDLTEPVSDAVRGILDGHVVLSRRLAQRAHFPAIDVLDSVSRLADEVSTREHIEARRVVTRLLAAYAEVEDLLQIGAYAKGANPLTDRAVELHERIASLLRQERDEHEEFETSLAKLMELSAAGARPAK